MFAPDTRAALAALMLTSAAFGCSRQAGIAADLIVTNAAIWTGNPAQPSAAAVAVVGDRIVDVGSAADIERWRTANTIVVDAEGRRVTPGFNDAHVRFVEGGRDLDDVDLRDAASATEFARRINERARARPGEWILGGRWDHRLWSPPVLPTRASIDEITKSSPVFVVSADGRMALANAAALGRAGITEQTPNPSGGALVRDANGFPTGVLQGAAMDLVARIVPPPTAQQRLHAVKRALEYAESMGITSVQDVGATYEDIGAFADLANRRELTVRIYAITPEGGWYDEAKLGLRRAFGAPWLRVGAVRASIDAVREAGETRTRLMAADHAGLQLSVSVGGGYPASPALDLLDDIARINGGRDRRFRLHTERISPQEGERVASLSVLAVVPPSAVEEGIPMLIDKGLRVSVASGWPSAPLNPLVNLAAAVSRGLTAAQALSALTAGPAFAEFQEDDKGTIARGRLADMVILSDDLLTLPAARIEGVRVLTVIAGGKVVHQRKP
jgi:predicted amidohydrolase YtcJ